MILFAAAERITRPDGKGYAESRMRDGELVRGGNACLHGIFWGSYSDPIKTNDRVNRMRVNRPWILTLIPQLELFMSQRNHKDTRPKIPTSASTVNDDFSC